MPCASQRPAAPENQARRRQPMSFASLRLAEEHPRCAISGWSATSQLLQPPQAQKEVARGRRDYGIGNRFQEASARTARSAGRSGMIPEAMRRFRGRQVPGKGPGKGRLYRMKSSSRTFLRGSVVIRGGVLRDEVRHTGISQMEVVSPVLILKRVPQGSRAPYGRQVPFRGFRRAKIGSRGNAGKKGVERVPNDLRKADLFVRRVCARSKEKRIWQLDLSPDHGKTVGCLCHQ